MLNKTRRAMIFEASDYRICVGDLAAAWDDWGKGEDYSAIYVLTDTHTAEHCLPVLETKIPALRGRFVHCCIPAGEQYKHLGTCETVWASMMEVRLDRKALVLNVGGGVIGDLGGFCAATWKRGVDFVQIPTTLLSMTDAAIGGKLGIDFKGVKNTIGVFRNPSGVWVDPAFLRTLPPRELRSGFAEVLKHAWIGDPALLERLAALTDLAHCTEQDWAEILQASIAVKVRVVAEDPLERGLRMVLNYGHTIGHAIETHFLNTPNPLTHGEAIAAGMLAESFLAYGPGPRLEQIQHLIERFFPGLAPNPDLAVHFWEHMLQDKKNNAGTVRMAVPDDTPFTYKVAPIRYEDLQEALLNLRF